MKLLPSSSSRTPVKFRIPTADNLVPIRLDIEIDGQRFKDAFTWNPAVLVQVNLKLRWDFISYAMLLRWDVMGIELQLVVGMNFRDSETFIDWTVKDLKLPPAFITQIAQSIQSQLTDFRSYEGQDMYAGEKIVPIKLDLRVNHSLIKDQFLWDMNNFESDPEEFARTFCRDMDIQDPEVGPAIAFAIREQLYEIAIQSVTSARESRLSKKGRRGFDYSPAIKSSGISLDLVKYFGHKSSVVRKRKDWDVFEPIVDILSSEEVGALEAREERNAR
ncbi:hypothetical protein CDL15_Pgr010634 [Punica granatum]|uniref:Chromatin structure-remodeling complex protein BSH n=1 Tax=Punica granatum TaxID=22663 RepID=A0A218VRR1_PUNGR|nr:hypothetical protein CDL15_Pgr010634 [Punica granatum]